MTISTIALDNEHIIPPTHQDYYTSGSNKPSRGENGQRPRSRSFRLDVYAYDSDRDTTHYVSDATLTAFLQICNKAFSGRQHEYNFGRDKLRYASIGAFRQDLENGQSGWVFLLHEAEGPSSDDGETMWTPVACAKVTRDAKGMDGGQGVHEVSVISSDDESLPSPETVYWLGALGSARSGAGTALLTGIHRFLLTRTPSSNNDNDGSAAYMLRAYSVHSWGIGEKWALPESSPLLEWFVRQGYVIHAYSWKPPGTWGSYYGACLADLRYIHQPASHPQAT